MNTPGDSFAGSLSSGDWEALEEGDHLQWSLTGGMNLPGPFNCGTGLAEACRTFCVALATARLLGTLYQVPFEIPSCCVFTHPSQPIDQQVAEAGDIWTHHLACLGHWTEDCLTWEAERDEDLRYLGVNRVPPKCWNPARIICHFLTATLQGSEMQHRQVPELSCAHRDYRNHLWTRGI